MVGQAPQPWRQRPGHHRTRRLADLDLQRAAGREHDTTAGRPHTEILPALADDLRSLGDLGYEGYLWPVGPVMPVSTRSSRSRLRSQRWMGSSARMWVP